MHEYMNPQTDDEISMWDNYLIVFDLVLHYARCHLLKQKNPF